MESKNDGIKHFLSEDIEPNNNNNNRHSAPVNVRHFLSEEIRSNNTMGHEDNSPRVKGKPGSVKKVLLGMLIGLIVGLLVVGIIIGALLFVYGTAGFGAGVLAILGGFGAVAAWSHFVGLSLLVVMAPVFLGGYIGKILSSEPTEPFLITEEVMSKDSLNTLGGLGGSVPQPQNESKPKNQTISDEGLNSIQLVNKKFKERMIEKYSQTRYQSKFENVFNTVDAIGKAKTSLQIHRAGLQGLEDGVYHFPDTNEYKQDILQYVADVRKAMQPVEKDEFVEEDNVRSGFSY